MCFRQGDHLSKKQIGGGQPAVVEAATRGKSQLAEVGLAIFEVEIGAHKGERFRQRFRIVEKLVDAVRFGERKAFRCLESLFVEPLQFPLTVEEIEGGALVFTTPVATEHIFGFPVETVELVVHRGVPVIGLYELFAQDEFFINIVLGLGGKEMELDFAEAIQVAHGGRDVEPAFVGANDIAATAEIPFQHELLRQLFPGYLTGGMVFSQQRVKDVPKAARLYILTHAVLISALLHKILIVIMNLQPLQLLVHRLRMVEVQLFVMAMAIEKTHVPTGRERGKQVPEPDIGSGAQVHRVVF